MKFRNFNKPRKSITGFNLHDSERHCLNVGINRISHFFDEVKLNNQKDPNAKTGFDNTKNIQNRDQRISIARRRIADGYYNSQEHLDKLADILLVKLGYDDPDIEIS